MSIVFCSMTYVNNLLYNSGLQYGMCQRNSHKMCDLFGISRVILNLFLNLHLKFKDKKVWSHFDNTWLLFDAWPIGLKSNELHWHWWLSTNQMNQNLRLGCERLSELYILIMLLNYMFLLIIYIKRLQIPTTWKF